MESGVRFLVVEANALLPRGWRKCRYEACRCQQEVAQFYVLMLIGGRVPKLYVHA